MCKLKISAQKQWFAVSPLRNAAPVVPQCQSFFFFHSLLSLIAEELPALWLRSDGCSVRVAGYLSQDRRSLTWSLGNGGESGHEPLTLPSIIQNKMNTIGFQAWHCLKLALFTTKMG